MGWAFLRRLAPVVEYLLCPIAIYPESLSRRSCEKISATRPISISECKNFPSDDTIPALSCPLCCKAWSPRYVIFAASGCPYIPNIPHINLGKGIGKGKRFLKLKLYLYLYLSSAYLASKISANLPLVCLSLMLICFVIFLSILTPISGYLSNISSNRSFFRIKNFLFLFFFFFFLIFFF